MTLPLAQEPVEISAAIHLCCIFKYRNREVVICDMTSATLRACLHQCAGGKAPVLKDWDKTLGVSFIPVDTLCWCLVNEARQVSGKV